MRLNASRIKCCIRKSLLHSNKPGQRLQTYPGINCRQYIVNHNPESAVNPPVHRSDGPRLQYVEETEQDKSDQHPLPARGSKKHGQPVAHHLVPDDAAMVVDAERAGTAIAPEHPQSEGDHQPGKVKWPGEVLNEPEDRNSGQGTKGPRRPRSEPTAEAEGKKVVGVGQQGL